MSDQERLVIAITPEPSPEELAAIVAAVTAAVGSIAPVAPPPVAAPSRWSRQGRYDAMRGIEREDVRR